MRYIMIRILSDRIAEAAAEYLHERIRKEYWGYAAEENLSIEDLLKIKYSGHQAGTRISCLSRSYRKTYYL